MKKFLCAALASLMLLGTAPAVFADDAAPTALTLADTSHLVLDTDAGYVDKIDGDITVAELKANFASAITVSKGDTAKADDAFVATDDIIAASDDSLKALIYGDVDRTGKINLTDVSATMKHIAKWNPGINEDAADVDKTGTVNLQDASKILRVIAGWPDLSLGNVRLVFENKPMTAEAEDDTLKLSFTSIMNKVGAHEIDHTGEHAYKIKMAKNEYESCTALLWSDTAKEGMSIDVTDFVSEYGDAVMEAKLEQAYMPEIAVFTQVVPWDVAQANEDAKHDNFPEVILPVADSFELEEGANAQFIITAASTKDTPAGMYTATLTVKDAEGKAVKCATVYAYVWDFTLPDTPYSASLFCTKDYYYEDDPDPHPYKTYYDAMLDYNLSSYKLPYSITDERADAYMSDPRVTAFVIDGFSGPYTGDISDEETVLAYEKVASDPEWFKKGLFYYTDEPWGEGLEDVRTTYEHVTELLGTTEIRNITPLAGNDGFGNDYCTNNLVDPVAYIDPYINVWCPQSIAFHLWTEGGNWGLRKFYNKYGEFADRAKAFKEAGEEMWWYVCCSPEPPYANYFTYYQGVIVRLLSWQQFFNDVDGVLYYSTSEGWGGITKNKFDIGNGDGTLQFPGEKFGFTGPQASWRLIQIRDGFDDFDFLRIAEELCGHDAVMEVVKKVSSGMLLYTEDYNVLEAARDEIAEMILENQAK